MIWVLATTTALGTLLLSLLLLPPQILFAKLTPKHVEATMFAFTGSVVALIFPLQKILGLLINWAFFDVSTQNLEDLYKLYLVMAGATLIPMLFVSLLPTWQDVQLVQSSNLK